MGMYQAGDYVKAEFKDEATGESEWMWVKVDHCDGVQRLVFGALDNKPPALSLWVRIGQFSSSRSSRTRRAHSLTPMPAASRT